MDFKTGGQQVILRLVEAYGFSTRQMLCDHLGVSKSTLATRFMRDIFPAEWVIQCAMETGASLDWLVTGEGAIFDNEKIDTFKIRNTKILNGVLHEAGYVIFDSVLIPSNVDKPLLVTSQNLRHLIELNTTEIVDGKWLIDIDGFMSIREINRIPQNRVRVTDNSNEFECNLHDVKYHGIVRLTIIQNI